MVCLQCATRQILHQEDGCGLQASCWPRCQKYVRCNFFLGLFSGRPLRVLHQLDSTTFSLDFLPPTCTLFLSANIPPISCRQHAPYFLPPTCTLFLATNMPPISCHQHTPYFLPPTCTLFLAANMHPISCRQHAPYFKKKEACV